MNLYHRSVLLAFFSFWLTPDVSEANFQCYGCTEQSDNLGKCVKTIVDCVSDRNLCLTKVRWASRKDWTSDARKQYYISKRCANETECSALKEKHFTSCNRIHYEDWECVDCCYGSLCNYYVTLGTSSIGPSILGILATCVLFITLVL